MSGQIALLDASRAEIDECLARIDIDPDFGHFVVAAWRYGFALHIVSDGLDYAIQRILRRHGLDLPVYANRLLHDDERKWHLEFPYGNKDCLRDSGNCKCTHADQQYQDSGPVIYIGDGASDYCVSGRVDVVLAKDRLITYCQKQAIPHYPIRNFADAQLLWLHLLSENYVACEVSP